MHDDDDDGAGIWPWKSKYPNTDHESDTYTPSYPREPLRNLLYEIESYENFLILSLSKSCSSV